jgi:hypothetical protein
MDVVGATQIEAAVSQTALGTSAEGLGKQLAAALQVALDDATELAQMFISMAAAVNDLPQNVRKDFPEAIVTLLYETEPQPPDARLRLERLIEMPMLRYTGKAWRLLHDQARVFVDCRIITDLRPLFGDDDTVIRAAAVTHHLRISFDSHSRNADDFYVALDSADLRSLRSVIDRALAKQASLEAFSKNAGVVVMSEELP